MWVWLSIRPGSTVMRAQVDARVASPAAPATSAQGPTRVIRSPSIRMPWSAPDPVESPSISRPAWIRVRRRAAAAAAPESRWQAAAGAADAGCGRGAYRGRAVSYGRSLDGTSDEGEWTCRRDRAGNRGPASKISGPAAGRHVAAPAITRSVPLGILPAPGAARAARRPRLSPAAARLRGTTGRRFAPEIQLEGGPAASGRRPAATACSVVRATARDSLLVLEAWFDTLTGLAGRRRRTAGARDRWGDRRALSRACSRRHGGIHRRSTGPSSPMMWRRSRTWVMRWRSCSRRSRRSRSRREPAGRTTSAP